MSKNILKIYLLHFSIAVISVITFLWIINLYLNKFTKHNEYINTPNVTKIELQKGIQIITSRKLRYTIIDSIYHPQEKSGIIVYQNPEPNTKVKENRNIYITITSFQPPSIEMPKLVDLSERQAIMILKSYDLKVGKIIYELSYCNGCVVKQLYKYKEILPGKYIQKGSAIDLIIGQKGNAIPSAHSDTINKAETSFE